MALWAEVLAWIALGLFAVAAALRFSALAPLSDYWEAPSGSSAELDAFDAAVGLDDGADGFMGFGFLVALAVAILLMVSWYKVLVAARRFGAEVKLGPGWAIGGWFVPLANAVLPSLVAANVRRIAAWRGTAPMRSEWRTGFPAPAVLISVFVVVAGLANTASGNIETYDVDDAMLRQTLSAIGDGAYAVVLLVTGLLVHATRVALKTSPLVRPGPRGWETWPSAV